MAVTILKLALLLLCCGTLIASAATTITVAQYQTRGAGLNSSNPLITDVALNLALLKTQCEAAAAQGAKVIIFPELFLTGYTIGSLTHTVAELADGPSFQAIAKIAVDNKISIIYGYPERDAADSAVVYNSANVVSSSGSLALTYRKTHLFGAGERALFTPGSQLGPVIELEGIKIGVLICYDTEFPENSRVLALMGAQFVAVPTANMAPYQIVNRHTVTVAAASNNFFFAYTNRWGVDSFEGSSFDFVGESILADPDGNTVWSAPVGSISDVLAVNTITIKERAASDWSYLVDRRPELYGLITKVNTNAVASLLPPVLATLFSAILIAFTL